ncbi:hypothetical protein Hypma_013211 [Hypsizygus marmoreus]|uniref:BHLH domain-containing protein n=1 Tax=Hypsizygus marmoreus TaxID=39966 RepID=A0A369JCD8_HYPMA|nr:hypothetical protein Hypma_013211 [Hypsizygus marmoreus]
MQSHESELPPIPPTQRQFTFVHAMPDAPSTPYAASCNPARRAKQPRASDALPNTTSTSTSSTATSPSLVYKKPAPILPATHPSTSSDPQPAKRGRKPGPLSRSARETQRKLNHSIIEKARRTKINDALATLRQLVPVDYGYAKKSKDKDKDEEDEEEDGDERDVDGDGDGSGDYEGRRDSGNGNGNGNGNGKKGKEKKTGGKREEKEKEFKLEILIRTVSFMQDLIARVNVLEDEAGKCTSCGEAIVVKDKETVSGKRKRDAADDGAEYRDPEKRQSRRSQSAHTDAHTHTQPPSTEEPTTRPTPYNGSRLPSISSWLPNVTNADIDPLLLSPTQHRLSPSSSTLNNNHQLPSPPSSTTFEPTHPTHLPPVLNLGPIATSALLSLSPRRTPEDESAATLLLQISASPATSGVGGAAPKFDLSRMRTGCVTPVGGGGGAGGGYAERERVGVGVQAQTPGSMLGLMNRRPG